MLTKKKNVLRHIYLLIILPILFVMSTKVYAEETNQLDVNAKAAVLMEPQTGKIILAQNPHEKLAPASITKVMTLLLIYESVEKGKINWADMVSISEHASGMGGSQVFLEPGEKQTVETLTKCIAIASANDAAVAMAEYIGGSEESFVQMMNEKAASLGMKDTTFMNACGLDAEGHMMSAIDVAIMSRELIVNYPDVYKYTKTWQDTITHVTKRGSEEFGLTNTNKLIKWYDGATGLKTGSTGKALYCLSGTAEKNGLSLIGVVLAAPDYKTRFQEVMKMFDYGFANYAIVSGNQQGELAGSVKVYKGDAKNVDAIINETISVLIKKGSESKIENNIELLPSVSAPIKKGDKVGTITYVFEGAEVGRSDLVAAEDVNKARLVDIMYDLTEKWFGAAKEPSIE